MDLDHYPLVIVHMPREGLTDDAVEKMLGTTGELFSRGGKFATLVHTRGARALANAKQRARIAEWEKASASRLRRHRAGTALIVDSGFLRGAMTAYRWLAPADQPELVTASELEGARFCLDCLERAGAPELTPARRYVRQLEETRRGA
ncbi:MAG: hypothetical protein CMN29_12535 [Sandaracinus sp.]|nr:hypothetical protein [Myxococcales bacterium]MAT25770.1 hypothetical protein [Sandaracinus sp.]